MATALLPNHIQIIPSIDETAAESSLTTVPVKKSGLSSLGKTLFECVAVLADQSGYSAVTFLAGILLARACTKTEYGLFVLGMTIVFAAEVILRSLIAIPYSVLFHDRDSNNRRAYAGHCLIQQILLSLGMIGLFGLIHLVAVWIDPIQELTRWLLGFSVAAALIHLRVFARSALLVEIRVWKNLAAGLPLNLLIALGLLALYAGGCLNVLSATLVLACGSALFAVITLGFDPEPPVFRRDRFIGDCRDNWNYGKWILLATGINLLGIRLFPWLTLFWWDTQTVATVGVLSVVVCAIRPAIQGGMNYLIPSLAQQARRLGPLQVISQGLSAAGLATILGFLFTVGMGLLGESVIRLLYTDHYGGHRFSLILFSAAMALKAVDVPLRATLTAIHEPRVLSLSTIAATFGAVLCALFLIPRFGVVGVAFSVLIHSLGCMAVNLGYVVILRRQVSDSKHSKGLP